MPQTVFEAIKQGIWNYEPRTREEQVESTDALPGSAEKLEVLAERLRCGLPLWHPADRRSFVDDVE